MGDKNYLHRLREASANYLAKELKLDVKDNWQVFPIADRGIDFLGYRFYPGYTLLRKSIALKFKRKMRKLQKGNIQPRSALSSVVSYYGWMCHANTLNLRRKYIDSGIMDVISQACDDLRCKNPLRKMVVCRLDFVEEPRPLEGDKIPIDSVLNREVAITNYRIGSTKYARGSQDRCLTLEIEINNEKRVIFTGSGVLIDQMEKYGDKVPFVAEIVKINKYYRLK